MGMLLGGLSPPLEGGWSPGPGSGLAAHPIANANAAAIITPPNRIIALPCVIAYD
jgi:hypothetical protein